MLHVEATQNLQPLPVLRASRVVIYAQDGVTPLVVAVEWRPGEFFVSKAGDADFVQTLRNLGIDRSVVVEQVQPSPLQLLSS